MRLKTIALMYINVLKEITNKYCTYINFFHKGYEEYWCWFFSLCFPQENAVSIPFAPFSFDTFVPRDFWYNEYLLYEQRRQIAS